MLPPVAALSDAFLGSFHQSNHTPLDPRVQIGTSETAVAPQPNAVSASFAGDRLSIMSLSGQLQLAQGLSVVAETLGTILKVERYDGETLSDYAERLGEVISGLSPSERIALQKALNQFMKGVTLRMLTEILKNPVGPEATRLALQLETEAYLVREPLAKKIVTSYRQNGGMELPLAPLPKPTISLEVGRSSAAQAGRLDLQSGVAPNAGIRPLPTVANTTGQLVAADSLTSAEEPGWPVGDRLPPGIAAKTSGARMVDVLPLSTPLNRMSVPAFLSYPQMDGYEPQDTFPDVAKAQVAAARLMPAATTEVITFASADEAYTPDQPSASRSLPAGPATTAQQADLADEPAPRAALDARSSASPVTRTMAAGASIPQAVAEQAEVNGSATSAPAAPMNRRLDTALATAGMDTAASDEVTYDGPALARMGLPASSDVATENVAKHDAVVGIRPTRTPSPEMIAAAPKALRLEPALIQALVEEVGVSGNWLAGIYAEESQDSWVAAASSLIAAGDAPKPAVVSELSKPMPGMLNAPTVREASPSAIAETIKVTDDSVSAAARAAAPSDAEPAVEPLAPQAATTGRVADAAAAAQATAAAQAALLKATVREAIVPVFVPYPPQAAYEDEERHLIEAVEAIDADGARNRRGGQGQKGNEGEAEGQMAGESSVDAEAHLDGDALIDGGADSVMQAQAVSGLSDAEAFYQRMAAW